MKKELSLYIHIPFCVRKCAYCDFLSFAAKEEEKEQYVQALIEEIKGFSQNNMETNKALVVSVFIGGGTPSILESQQIRRIMDVVFENFQISSTAEITIEANPGTVTYEKLKSYKECGINRISFGLQSSKEEELKLLGRIHSYEQFEENFHLARKVGFDNISVDLMSALPKQTLPSWKESLERIVALSPEHISAYSLIIEEGTPFYEAYKEEDVLRGQGKETTFLPDEETERAITHWTKTYLESHGYGQYEISNYGKSGKESVHNIGYWVRREYIGFGLGAASFINNVRYSNTSSMKEYLMKGRDAQSKELLSQEDAMEEHMVLGLRMTKGVSKKQFFNTFHKTVEEVYGQVIEGLKKEQLLEENEQYVWLTTYGLDVSNYCMAQFLLE